MYLYVTNICNIPRFLLYLSDMFLLKVFLPTWTEQIMPSFIDFHLAAHVVHYIQLEITTGIPHFIIGWSLPTTRNYYKTTGEMLDLCVHRSTSYRKFSLEKKINHRSKTPNLLFSSLHHCFFLCLVDHSRQICNHIQCTISCNLNFEIRVASLFCSVKDTSPYQKRHIQRTR